MRNCALCNGEPWVSVTEVKTEFDSPNGIRYNPGLYYGVHATSVQLAAYISSQSSGADLKTLVSTCDVIQCPECFPAPAPEEYSAPLENSLFTGPGALKKAREYINAQCRKGNVRVLNVTQGDLIMRMKASSANRIDSHSITREYDVLVMRDAFAKSESANWANHFYGELQQVSEKLHYLMRSVSLTKIIVTSHTREAMTKIENLPDMSGFRKYECGGTS